MPPEEGWDWIEAVVKVGKVVGINPVRFRWRLRALRNSVRARRDRAVMEGRSLTRGLKQCPACKSMAGHTETECPRCGHALHSMPVEFVLRALRRLGIGIFSETFLAICMILAFVVPVAVNGSGAVLGFPGRTLIELGGNLAPYTASGQWWRLWTAVFIHDGIIHLAFNLYVLLYLAPRCRDYYGANRTLIVFGLSGIAASALSMAWALSGGPDAGVSVGASGAIAGLIGLMMVRGQKDKSRAGIELRNGMIRWMVYIIIFGFLVGGVDNAAHVGGFIAGAFIGSLLPIRLQTRFAAVERAGGIAVLVLSAAAAGLVCYFALLPVIAGK